MKFEDNLKELENLVAQMESGRLNLDAMIEAYEKGRKLEETCRKDLDSIRTRIEKVTADGATDKLTF